MKHPLLLSLLLVPLLVCGSATAQSSKPKLPNVLGTWECKNKAVFLGIDNHKPQEALVPTTTELSTTFVFTSQEGPIVIGTMASPQVTETVIGVVGHDNTTVELVDEDGYRTFTLVGKKKATTTYKEVSATTLVAARGRCNKID